MIHKVLNLRRPLIIFDLETTGVDVDTARIVEIGFQLYRPDTGLAKEWVSLINPEIPIPFEVTKIHHIDDESVTRRCAKCKQLAEQHPFQDCESYHPVPRFRDLAGNLAMGFSNVDFGGKNVRFDLRIFAKEMMRAHVDWSYTDAFIIDAERLEQLGEPRTLSHLYEKHTGEKLDGAHSALTDVRASAIVIEKQLQCYAHIPRAMGRLHELQWPGWVDSDGKIRYINGVPVVQFGKYKGQSMKSVPRDYWLWVLKQDFSHDFKQLAKNAAEGLFPSNVE